MTSGHYKQPSIYKDTIYFVSDDNIYKVDKTNKKAIRLTTNLGHVELPKISIDGNLIAYQGREQGTNDIYLMHSDGGESERLTWLSITRILGWKNESTILFCSSHEAPQAWGCEELFEVNIKSKKVTKINLGIANRLAYGEKGAIVIGRQCGDPSRWKRYQGGTAGKLWVKENSKAKFKKILTNILHNLTDPKWIKNRIYFISDHEGISNIYSINKAGKNIKRHTHHEDYYVRNLETDQKNIVYQSGSDLYKMDLSNNKSEKIEIDFHSPSIQALPRFENASKYLDHFQVDDDSKNIAFVSRGQLYMMHPWNGAPYHLGKNNQIRYGKVIFSKNNTEIVVSVNSENGEDKLTSFNTETRKEKPLANKISFGKIWSIQSNPQKDIVAVTNNRKELWLIPLKKGTPKRALKNEVGRVCHINWSPDGKYLAYSYWKKEDCKFHIAILDTTTNKSKDLFESVIRDSNPVFDPSGKYLYFLSVRELSPVYNETHFDLGFPHAQKPYVVSLSKDAPNPFESHLNHIDLNDDEDKENDSKKKNKKKKLIVKIDFDGIENRILPFPVKIGGYQSLYATTDKIFWTKSENKPVSDWDDLDDNATTLYSFSFEDNKEEKFHKNIYNFQLSNNKKKMILLTSDGLRVVPSDNKPKEDADDENRKDGWINLNKVCLKIDPRLEWKQMYKEAWFLQKEHFWAEDLSKVEWKKVYDKYLKLLPRIRTRLEMSDLLWEMQGELGTSHCYEFMGDYYLRPPSNPFSKLGAVLKFDEKDKSFKITEIKKGDSWIKEADSPLNNMGVSLSVGDVIYEINGEKFKHHTCLYRILENKAGKKINILLKRKGKKNKEDLCINTLRSEIKLRYREWVEKNKSYVHHKTNGKIGYLHIPDMGPKGFAEFYRNYLGECKRGWFNRRCSLQWRRTCFSAYFKNTQTTSNWLRQNTLGRSRDFSRYGRQWPNYCDN